MLHDASWFKLRNAWRLPQK